MRIYPSLIWEYNAIELNVIYKRLDSASVFFPLNSFTIISAPNAISHTRFGMRRLNIRLL